eukprot:PhF_6_TR35999/c1_g1_i3/m.52156
MWSRVMRIIKNYIVVVRLRQGCTLAGGGTGGTADVLECVTCRDGMYCVRTTTYREQSVMSDEALVEVEVHFPSGEKMTTLVIPVVAVVDQEVEGDLEALEVQIVVDQEVVVGAEVEH